MPYPTWLESNRRPDKMRHELHPATRLRGINEMTLTTHTL